jgi:plasmid stabilization system protein ParE
MDYKIIVTQEAHDDIDEIIGYITNVLRNPIAAGNLLTEIEDSYKIIEQAPEAFAYCNDKRLRKNGYRKIVVKSYIIFYRVDYEASTVNVMRVIYGRRAYIDLKYKTFIKTFAQAKVTSKRMNLVAQEI